MPAGKLIAGPYAAVLAPKDTACMLDERAFRSLVGFLHGKTLDRLVLNGATGEYCVNSPDDLRRMLGICRDVLGPAGEFLAGVGSYVPCRENPEATLSLGRTGVYVCTKEIRWL